jgi:FtsP/CotA-like multicopper oxidase with cupredoxin domain
MLAYGLPIALAALMAPALILLATNRPTEAASATAVQAQATTHDAHAAAASQPVVLQVKEWSFEPKTLQLPVGQPTTLVLENKGKLDHDVSIPSLGVSVKAAAGQSSSQTITPTREGTFDFLCSIPGHKEAGMQGTLSVASAAAAAAHAAAPAPAPAAAPTAGAMASHAAVATTATNGNQPLAYTLDGGVKVFDLKAQHVNWEVLPGEFVDAYAYNGQVPGSLIRVTEGDHVRINFTNELPEPTVIHFHGPRLPNAMDGVPDVTQKAVQPGESFSYEFTAQPAGTFMYHTHFNSAEQEGKGLHGVFIVDPKEPTVQYDREVIQVQSEMGGYFLINGKSFPATEAVEAKVGERVLIHLINLGQMTHPMHMHGHPFQVVGTDGYPVPESQAVTKDVINIGPGERYDLLMKADNPGAWLFHCHILTHVQNHGVEPGGMIIVFKVTE